MDIDKFIEQALALTYEVPGFNEGNLDEAEFGRIFKDSEKLVKKIQQELGAEGLSALCEGLEDKGEWQEAAQFFESLCYDD